MAARVIKPLAGLVQNNNPQCSMGRVAFWIVFGLSIYFWLFFPIKAFPPTLEQALILLLAYNLGGKIAHNYNRGRKRNAIMDEG